jgi:tetratricopeptide (TPR) repeat protein
LLENVVEEFPDEIQYRAELASAYVSHGSELAGISPASGRRDAHRDAVAILEQVVGDSPNVVDYQIRLSSAYMSLGSRPDLDFHEAEQALQNAIRLCTRLVAEFPDQLLYKLELANGHYCLGYMLVGRGRSEAAEKSYRNVLALCATSDDATSSLNQRWLLALGHSGLAVVLAATSRADEAESACREAIRLRAKLVLDFPDVPNYLASLADEYNRLGILLHNARKFAESAEERLKAAGMYEKLAAQFPGEPVYAMLQAEMYYYLVDTYELDNRPREAKDAWSKVVQLYDTSAAPILKDSTDETLRANAYFIYARGLAARNRPREAEQACYVALKLQEKLVAKTFPSSVGRPGPNSRLATLHHLLGRLFQASNRPQEAENAYRRALEFWPTRAMYHNDLAWLLVSYPDPRIHKPAEAVALAKKACGIQPKMYNVWNTLGVAHYRAGDYRDAIAALEKSNELGREIEFGFNALFIAMCHGQLGAKEQSRDWYEKAVNWHEKRPTKSEELERFRKEAELLIGVKNTTK